VGTRVLALGLSLLAERSRFWSGAASVCAPSDLDAVRAGERRDALSGGDALT
jgi:hypothetical protein